MCLVAVMPAVAAAIIGLVTTCRRKSPDGTDRRGLSALLTIGGVVSNQWRQQHEANARGAARSITVETLGTLIDGGETLQAKILNSPDKPIPVFEINDWIKKSEDFLQALGTRMPFDLGLMLALCLLPTIRRILSKMVG
jgi:hypothetical protein